MSKLLQNAGLAALALWTAGGAAAWMLTKEQVHLTIEPGPGQRGPAPDPVAALSERIGALEDDLRGLTKALNQNLRALDEGIETAAGERAAATQSALSRVEANLTARSAVRSEEIAGLRETLTALRGEVQNLAQAVAANAAAPRAPDAAPGPAAAMTQSADPKPPVDELVVAKPAPDESAAPAPALQQPVAQQPPPAKPPRKKSFLAFELPSDSFAFAGRRQWQVIPSLSRAGFDAKSTLHDFTGATTRVEGTLVADLAQPAAGTEAKIVVDAASLDTGLPDRNAAMCEHLGTKEHARIEFELTGFAADRVDSEKMQVTGTASGKLTIRGKMRVVTMPVRLGVDASRRLSIEGETSLDMKDYGVEVPSKMGLISVNSVVKVWIALRARPLAKESN